MYKIHKSTKRVYFAFGFPLFISTYKVYHATFHLKAFLLMLDRNTK